MRRNCLKRFHEGILIIQLQDAIEIARELDEKAKKAGYQKPSLFGIPVSIKENIRVNMHSFRLFSNFPTYQKMNILIVHRQKQIKDSLCCFFS